MINRGKTLANLDSVVYCGDVLVAKANGTYAIFKPGQSQATTEAAANAMRGVV